jgi:hypothetical protein
MAKEIKQANGKKEYKCIFCGKVTYFEDEGTAYCIDCYCKLRNSAHTHELPKNTPITPMPTTLPSIFPNTYPGPYKVNPGDFPRRGDIMC